MSSHVSAQNLAREDSQSDIPTATSTGIQLARDADLLICSYLPPLSDSSIQDTEHELQVLTHETRKVALPLPFCLPQLAASPKFDSAFVRGYNPALEEAGITQEMILNFIDGLNIAIAASPPLRVVSIAGGIIGFVPYHWAIIAGALMQVAARTSMRVLSKTLTDRYLRSANLNLFKPRGLSVRLCTTSAMLFLLSNSTTPKQSVKEKLNEFGRGVGKVILKFPPLPIPIIPQVAKNLVRTIADKPPKIPSSELGSDQPASPVVLRRLAMIEGLALSVEARGMPPPAKPRKVMERISSWGVRFDGKMEARTEKHIEQRRRAVERFALAEAEAEAGSAAVVLAGGNAYQDAISGLAALRPSKTPNPQSNMIKRIASNASDKFKQRQWENELQAEAWERTARDVQRQQQAVNEGGLGGNGGGLLSPILDPLLGQKMTKMEEKVADADLLEYWATDKVLWVLIVSTEKDADIDGIERAEDPANEERVSREEWRAEMEVERGEMAEA